MRRHLYILIILFFFGCSSKEKNMENKDHRTTSFAESERVVYYGDHFELENAVQASDLKDILKGRDSMDVKVEGRIIEVCQKKGCWMDMKLKDGDRMKITFKDYGFFVPKDAAGKNVLMDGTVKKEMIDIATLKHYAEDAGKSDAEIESINAPQEKIVFEARGVALINDSKQLIESDTL